MVYSGVKFLKINFLIAYFGCTTIQEYIGKFSERNWMINGSTDRSRAALKAYVEG